MQYTREIAKVLDASVAQDILEAANVVTATVRGGHKLSIEPTGTKRQYRKGLSLIGGTMSKDKVFQDVLTVLMKLPGKSQDLFDFLRTHKDTTTNLMQVSNKEIDQLFSNSSQYKAECFKPLYEKNLVKKVPKTIISSPVGFSTYMLNPDLFMVYDKKNLRVEEEAIALWDSLK